MQRVGIGKEEFPFSRTLGTLLERIIDDAGFMPANDIDAIKDAELYETGRGTSSRSGWRRRGDRAC